MAPDRGVASGVADDLRMVDRRAETTASTNEMRALRLADVYLSQGTMQIRSEGAKNKFRIRTIPLQTPEIVWARRADRTREAARVDAPASLPVPGSCDRRTLRSERAHDCMGDPETLGRGSLGERSRVADAVLSASRGWPKQAFRSK